MGFRETFLSTPAGPEREALVYSEAIKKGPPKTVPITVSVPDVEGMTVTYNVMPDFLMIEGIRTPMSAFTAQRLANHFGMTLPTSKMVDQTWQAAKRTGSNLVAHPLSGSGVEFEGKEYSAQDVVADVSRPEFAVAYNERIDSDPTFQENKGKDVIYSGHMKEIVQPSGAYRNRLHFRGLMDKDGNPIQTGRSPHPSKNYSEYAAGARFIDNKVKITTKDGRVIDTTLNQLMRVKNLSKAISDTPRVQQYRGAKKGYAGPPPGYTSAKFPNKQVQAQAQAFAKTLLRSKKPLWSLVPVSFGGRYYVAKLEPHGKDVPRAVSIYQRKGGAPKAPAKTEAPEKVPTKPTEKPEAAKAPTSTVEQRNPIWDRVNNFLNKINIF